VEERAPTGHHERAGNGAQVMEQAKRRSGPETARRRGAQSGASGVWVVAGVLALAVLVFVMVVGDGTSRSDVDPRRSSSASASTTNPAAGSTPNGSGGDQARPFSAASPWNTPTPSGTQWFDTPTLHSLATPVGGDSFRHWWVNTESLRIWSSKSTDPVWTFTLPDDIAPAWHRDRPATTFEMRAPWRVDSKGVRLIPGSPVVTDPSITDADAGKGVTWPGAVGRYYVSSVTAGFAFILSSSPSTEVDLDANVGASSVTIGMTTGSDGDLLVLVDPTSGKYVEVWPAAIDLADKTVATKAGANAAWARGNAITGPGAGTISNNDGVRPANFSSIGGVLTGGDFASGKIDHALGISLPGDMLKGGAGTPLPYRAPATAADSGGANGPILTGSRIGIPSGTPKPAKLSATGSMVFDALEKYGAFVSGFTGGTWPMFYADNATVTPAQVEPLYAFFNHGGSSDMEKIGPLLRVADYQP
jgi:hypothetical protein